MSEQTANLCTTDACESLRQRLAKYEDAEGRSVDDSEIAAALAMAKVTQYRSLGYTRETAMRKVRMEELAALKAQPSGVVQWPDADEIMQMAFEEGQPGDDASGYYFELEEFDLFIQRLMEEVARLNSSPVSTGATVKQSLTAGGVDERVPELSSFVAFADALGLDLRQSDDQWNSALVLYEKLIAAYPQARAALSAPSHGEQVRERLAAAIPYLRHAISDAEKSGVAQLAVVSTLEDGSGRVVCRFDCAEFMADVATVVGVGSQTEEDTLRAEARQFLDKHGITCDPSVGSQEQG